MKILFFNSEDGELIPLAEPESTKDEVASDVSTTNYDPGKIANVDIDEASGAITLYTEGLRWYIVLDAAEVEMIRAAIVAERIRKTLASSGS